MQSEQNLKYILYARKSTESEDRQASSIEDQVSEMKRLATRLGIHIVKTITESKSAKKPGRHGFNEMTEYIYSGKANGILCWKLNRLARNPVDGGQISWMLQQGHIQHIQTYSSEYKPTDNVLMMQVEFGMANQFVNDLSIDVRRGMRTKADRGWYPVSHLPSGYKHNTGFHSRGELDEIVCDDNFEILRSIWTFMLTGQYSVSDLRRKGTALGFINRKTKRGYSLNTYFKILSDEFYCGYFTWYDENGHEKRLLGKHMPMVSEEEFNRVQMLLGKKGKPTRVNKCDFPFRGPIQCGSCGCSVTAERKLQAICTSCKTKFSTKTRSDCPRCGLDLSDMRKPSLIDKTYYHCTRKRGPCAEGSVTEEKLEKQIVRELKRISISRNFYQWAVQALKDQNEKESGAHESVHRDLKKREGDALKRIDNLVLMRANGEITAEQMAGARTQTDIELQQIRKEINLLHTSAIDWMEVANRYLTFAERALTEFNNGSNEKKRTILQNFGPNLILKDQNLIITFAKPLIAITDLQNQFNEELKKLEPKNGLGNQDHFDLLNSKSSKLCAGRDLNPRRPKPPRLQRGVIDHSTTDAHCVIVAESGTK